MVVGASASQSVELGSFPLSSDIKRFKKLVSTASLFRGGCGEQADKFACCVLGQDT